MYVWQVGFHTIKRVQNEGGHPVTEFLHIENWITCCIETHLLPNSHGGQYPRHSYFETGWGCITKIL